MASSQRNGAVLHCFIPQLLAIDVEHELWILRHSEPAAERQFALKLSGTPTGVTKRNKALLGSCVVAYVAEYLGIGGHRDAAIDIDGAGAVIVGTVYDETDLWLHGSAGEQAHGTLAALAVETECLLQL